MNVTPCQNNKTLAGFHVHAIKGSIAATCFFVYGTDQSASARLRGHDGMGPVPRTVNRDVNGTLRAQGGPKA
jgi:hypothetical protein